jgi:MoaA/NifB/PqqE/SkfB family radical SAM enzyme
MDRETMLRAASEIRAAGVQRIRIIGGGEPTLHPSFCELLRCFEGIAPVLSVTTNGHVIDDRKTKMMAQIADLVEVSVGSNDPQLFAISRTGGDLRSVVQFLGRLKEFRKCNRRRFLIQARLMVNPSQLEKLELARAFWERHADVVTVDRLFDYFSHGGDLCPPPITGFQLCRQLFRGVGIHWNGDVPLCSMSDLRHGSGGIILGNIRRQSLAAIWQCALLQTYREAHVTGDSNSAPGCDGCPRSR